MKKVLLFCILFCFNLFLIAEEISVQKLKEFSTIFRDIAKKVSPSVVSIEVSKTVEYIEDPYGLNRFFNLDSGRGRRIKKKVEVSSGSGFIADAEGHILTNFHVIEEGQEVNVTLMDGRKVAATFVGGDNELDIAVLKIQLARITPCEFGDSSKVEVGDWVLAIGNPYGYSHTVTEGIISAKYRENNSLQTSAAINPGNSGGPLIDLDGRVIGINRSIKTTTGSNIGIGFSIPINIVKRALSDIIKYKKIKYGTIGVSLVDQNNKCVVEKIFIDSPAKKGKNVARRCNFGI
jgi:serine protease Do